MIILHVKGEDYSAMNFEENFDPDEVYKQMVEMGRDTLTLQSDDYYIEVEVCRFDIVDEHFFDFVKYELIDYDIGKHENIYLIGG